MKIEEKFRKRLEKLVKHVEGVAKRTKNPALAWYWELRRSFLRVAEHVLNEDFERAAELSLEMRKKSGWDLAEPLSPGFMRRLDDISNERQLLFLEIAFLRDLFLERTCENPETGKTIKNLIAKRKALAIRMVINKKWLL